MGRSLDSLSCHGAGITMLVFVIGGWVIRAIDECLMA